MFLLKNIDCEYSLDEMIQTNTHNLCFEQK